MKKIILALLTLSLLSCPAYASKQAGQKPVEAGIQEAQAATLDDDSETPKKKKTVKKTKKTKKAKKTKSNG